MIETRDFQLDLKALTETGTLEGLAAGYGNIDRQGDVMAAGAFAKSIQTHRQRGTMPAMLLHHDMKRPAGAWESFTETPAGLLAKGRLALETADGREAYSLLKAKALTGLSVGFTGAKRAMKATGPEIVEGELLEVSLVAIPANPEALVTRVKSTPTARDIEQALIGAGLSNRQAKAGAALVAKHLQSNTDDDEQAERLAALIASARTDLQTFIKRN
jgi:HK97 family phage prohead protease